MHWYMIDSKSQRHVSNDVGEDNLQMETQHPESLQKIQQLESLDKYPKMEIPEAEYTKPVWTKSFDNIDNLQEGEIVFLNGLIEPAEDPNLKVEWFHNGAPLQNCKCNLKPLFYFFLL